MAMRLMGSFAAINFQVPSSHFMKREDMKWERKGKHGVEEGKTQLAEDQK